MQCNCLEGKQRYCAGNLNIPKEGSCFKVRYKATIEREVPKPTSRLWVTKKTRLARIDLL
jgi:hypothetical protein